MSRDFVPPDFHREVNLRINYEADLNPQQRAAVQASAGPSLVLAGAGSGKTRTLIYRVAFLLEQGVPAEQILLLTFTNKAAREMMRRVADLLGAELTQLWGGTFHSIGARVLRLNADALGFRSDYSILDREDSESLIRECIRDLQENSSIRLPKPVVLANIFSRAANERRAIGDVLSSDPEWDYAAETIAEVHKAYRERKQASNVMDFDDLLVLWLKLLEEHEDIRERYQRRFQWILVDEYQDTNQIQSDLIDLLGRKHRNVMAVGDDSQSIYSWRGANFRNILEFPHRYPDARIFKIETNYRSTPEILAVANAAISANRNQFEKVLTHARPSGGKPALVLCEDTWQQAAFIGEKIAERAVDGVPLTEIAVLYRSHFHAVDLQMELTRRRIPFVITSGIRFFEQAHVKDVTAWLKLLVNPTDEVAFRRLVQLVTGIGPRAAQKMWDAYLRAREEASQREDADALSVARLFMAVAHLVPKKAAVEWAKVATTMAQIGTPSMAQQPAKVIRAIVDGFYEDYAHDAFANSTVRLDELSELADFASGHPSLVDFLTQMALLANMEAESEARNVNPNEERVRLSTIHQAKGLEFRVVFVIMMAEGLFPSSRSLQRPDSEEEERRLFYVAVTRAKDELYLASPSISRTGDRGVTRVMRSRFLNEIPSDLLHVWDLRSAYSRSTYLEEMADALGGADDDTPF